MKNFKSLLTILALLIALAAFSPLAHAQYYTLSSTTLGAAITSTNATTITLASTSTMLNSGPNNLINTALYVDKEFMTVTTVVDSTHAIVRRGGGVGGLGGIPTMHANGAKVYFANSQGTVGTYGFQAADRFFYGGPNTNIVYGGCVQSAEFVLPKIYTFSGEVLDCKGGTTAAPSQWFVTGSGSMSGAGRMAQGFCTGSLGSAETEYLNDAACSGATTATAQYVVSSPGTIANLYVSAGTAVTGGTSKDVLTVVKNGTATAITCTIAASGTSCSDTSHSVATVAGDVIQFKWVTATSDAGANIAAAVGIY